MSKISIVTAFYDIGRGDWTPDKGLPHYLHRTTDTYIERFSQLLKLDNDIVVYTSSEIAKKLTDLCENVKENVTIVEFDVFTEFDYMRQEIYQIQQNPEFQRLILPSQSRNPEYWNPDYVLVTNLKAHFTNKAIDNNLVENDMVAWIDFGYCRSSANIPSSKTWQYDFDKEKIHLFNYKDYDYKSIIDIVASNDVYILGAKVVAHKDLWPKMEHLMFSSQDNLKTHGMVDDDQGLWLMSYIQIPELFELHKIPDHQFGHDPFVLFNEFNNTL